MQEVFNQQGYVHLKGFLDEQNCQELTSILKDLVAQGKTRHGIHRFLQS